MTDAAAPTGQTRARRKARASAEPTTPDAIEIAMDAEASGEPPTSPARLVLERQAHLIGWQIASERASFALKVLTGVTGVIAAVVVGAVLWVASQYRGVTVQPFSAPPELQARGLTGAAIATRLLDKLSALQGGTISLRAANTFANSWGDDIQVEIPQTGVSAGELWRFLRSWLGEEVKISGEVVRTPTGLQITARAGGQAAPLITGSEAEIEAMLDRIAEAIYAKTQPYRYTVYLGRVGRKDEALKVFEELARTGNATDRKWAYAGWALRLTQAGRFEESIEKATASLAIDPKFGLAYANRSGAKNALGWAEQAYLDDRLAVQNLRDSSDINPVLGKAFLIEIRGSVKNEEHDDLAALALYHQAATQEGVSGRSASVMATQVLSRLRETSAAHRLSREGSTQTDPSWDDYLVAGSSLALEDWGLAAQTLDRIDAASARSKDFFDQRERRRHTQPVLALALARTGRLAEARASLDGAPLDSYWVVIAKGEVAALDGDIAESERWFAKAAAQAPSLADADQAWGRARLDRRDLTGAIDRFRIAGRKAPRWADPLKLWGDALAAQGHHRAAIGKYAQAEDRAPRWGALHLAWARALIAQGRGEQARARLRIAAGLDLSPADRAAVERLLTPTRH